MEPKMKSILPLLFSATLLWTVASLEVDKEKTDSISPASKDAIVEENAEPAPKSGRKSKQFWPILPVHTRVSNHHHVITPPQPLTPIVSSHHYVRSPQAPFSLYQFSRPLNGEQNKKADRRVQLEDDVRVADTKGNSAMEELDGNVGIVVESVNRMIADAQKLNTKSQSKEPQARKADDKMDEGDDAEEDKEGDAVEYKVEGRQSLNGADISADLFGNTDDLVLPGRPNLAPTESLAVGAPQLSPHLGVGGVGTNVRGRPHDYHHGHDIHDLHDVGGLHGGHHGGHHDIGHHGIRRPLAGLRGHHGNQQCCLFVFFDGSAYYFDDYLRLLTGPYRLMYGTVNGRPHYVARGCKDPDAYGPNCSYIWNSGYGWIIGIGTYIGQTKGVIYTRGDGACPTANNHARWRYLNKDLHWKDNGNIVLECAS